MNRLAILGGGSWGTALAITLAPRFREVGLWVHDPDRAVEISRDRVNRTYLPEFVLPPNIAVTANLQEACVDADIVLFVTPSHHLRAVALTAASVIRAGAVVVSAVKGLEAGSLLRMSEVLAGTIGSQRIAVLSGPTFAKEVAAGEPAAVVISSAEPDIARLIQAAFSGPAFRLYTNNDPVGVEIGAALKNVIAIGAGICHGLGLGSNPVAALVTRGLAEITRLAVALGGQTKTLAGLAGLGDLVLTCTGHLSRNRHVGVELGRGRTLAEILTSMQMVAEGVQTTFAAVDLSRRVKVEMPITEQMHDILQMRKSPLEGVRDLMDRSLKGE